MLFWGMGLLGHLDFALDFEKKFFFFFWIMKCFVRPEMKPVC